MDLMLQPLRRYADFNGRARRSEYWLFALFVALVQMATGILSWFVGGDLSEAKLKTYPQIMELVALMCATHGEKA